MHKVKSQILVLLLFMVSCWKPSQIPSTTIDYEYSSIDEFKVNFEDIFSYSPYLLYVYSPYCSHCNEIKNEMIPFILRQPITIKVLEYSSVIPVKAITYDLVGVSTLNDFFIYGYPTLIEFDNYIVIDYFLGTNNILKYIENF